MSQYVTSKPPRLKVKIPCKRCGLLVATGGHTAKRVCCRSCWAVDPAFCRSLVEDER